MGHLGSGSWSLLLLEWPKIDRPRQCCPSILMFGLRDRFHISASYLIESGSDEVQLQAWGDLRAVRSHNRSERKSPYCSCSFQLFTSHDLVSLDTYSSKFNFLSLRSCWRICWFYWVFFKKGSGANRLWDHVTHYAVFNDRRQLGKTHGWS